ncbi:MAG TPA: phosphoadenylyl-sulfate reductase [Jiangellaceae bacterium]|nr:phosphoadenylyl-sulfate reductase [Jiangellaceae bacterium]
MSKELADRAAAELEGAEALDVLSWATTTFGRRLAVASSMQDAVLAHLVSRVLPDVDVLFLDTGYHFAETLATREEVDRLLPVTVVDVLPRQSVAEQDAEYGERLHDRDPDLCCFLRKVDPLATALQPYQAWVSGVRRDESPTRAQTPVVTWDDAHGLVKVNPLVRWTRADIDAYESEHDLPVNTLTGNGYPSIGCAPCTRRVAPGQDPRSGRWAGTGKTECGIHR